MKTRKIVWERWIDPFLTNLDEVELPENVERIRKAKERAIQDMHGISDEELEEADKEQRTAFVEPPEDVKVLVGPFGIVPMCEHNLPSKLYNFWMFHTNFDLSDEISKTILGISGVELYHQFSRYRGRIAIGKIFDSQQVKKNIEQTLCGFANREEMFDTLGQEHKYWAIYTDKAGRTKQIGGDSIESIQGRLALYERKVAREGGNLEKSW